MKKAGILLLLILVVLPFVSAELSLDQPKNLYNLGDEFNISITVSETRASNDFLKANLVCDSQEAEIYRNPLNLIAGGRAVVEIKTFLDKTVIGSLKGNCFIKAEYAGENINGRQFEITSEVSVVTNLQKSIVDPGQKIEIFGTAIKKNGKKLDGIAELKIAGLELNYVTPVSSGEFVFNATLPEDAKSGNYGLIIRAYEKDLSDRIINEGNSETDIKVKQILKKIEVALTQVSLQPGQMIGYKVIGYDQGGKEMASEVQVKITRADRTVELDRISMTGENQNFTTLENSTPGSWIIEAQAGEIAGAKSFLLSENENASFEMVENALIIRNTGNVPYNKPVAISIGNVQEIRDVFIDVGGEKKFRMAAPDGEYEISVVQSNSSINLGKTFLTGRSIAVKDNDGNNSFFGKTIIWIIVLLAAIVAIYFYYNRIKDGGSITIPRSSFSYGKNEQGIVHGEKQKTSIVSVRIKNSNSDTKDNLLASIRSRILEEARSMKATTNQTADSITAIFAPIMTKKEDNAQDAVTLATKIKRILDEHNKKHKQRLDYGVGINEGDLIVEISEGRFRFSPAGTTIQTAKNLAGSANGEILLSDRVHASTRARVKVEKAKEGWRIAQIKDNSKYAEFRDKFVEKNFR
ncbi:MAG: adenylate/guanylate cyclase domain-containing protein [Nanoarchaeota archaeon]